MSAAPASRLQTPFLLLAFRKTFARKCAVLGAQLGTRCQGMDQFYRPQEPDEGYSEYPLNPSSTRPRDASTWLSRQLPNLPLSERKGELVFSSAVYGQIFVVIDINNSPCFLRHFTCYRMKSSRTYPRICISILAATTTGSIQTVRRRRYLRDTMRILISSRLINFVVLRYTTIPHDFALSDSCQAPLQWLFAWLRLMSILKRANPLTSLTHP